MGKRTFPTPDPRTRQLPMWDGHGRPAMPASEHEPDPAPAPASWEPPPGWPSMLFHADPEGSLYRKATATYSADRLGAPSKLRGAFMCGGRAWFSMGDAFIDWNRHPELAKHEWIGVQCEEIVPAASWKGETIESYHVLTDRWRDGDRGTGGIPRGNKTGLVVLWKGARYVCTGLRLQVAVCIAVAIGAPRHPLPEREALTVLEDRRLMEEARRYYTPSELYQEHPELRRVLAYDGGYWINTGGMSSSMAGGEWVEEVYCLELIPREEWEGPTRNGTQRIKGEAGTAFDSSRRGVAALCLEDKRRYVCTGRTISFRYLEQADARAAHE